MSNFNEFSERFSFGENKQKPSTGYEYRPFEQQKSFPHGLYNTHSTPSDNNAFENLNTESAPQEFEQPNHAKQQLDAQSQQTYFYTNSWNEKPTAYRDTNMYEEENNYNQQESVDQKYDPTRKEEVNKKRDTFFEPTEDKKYDPTNTMYHKNNEQEYIPQRSYNNDQEKSYSEPKYKLNGYKYGNPFTGGLDARNFVVDNNNNQLEGEEDEP
ncbi:UPF0297 protein SSU05_0066 [Striga asiatica]|uniref:UPF0297 protein SSU05_0066 n=1 Tax=Striga asiatica TaxID=4170 RepID=A0A5A7PGN8_STRAF|nr:UPF0297 protein SSU05_0066 [Striga asiatica]